MAGTPQRVDASGMSSWLKQKIHKLRRSCLAQGPDWQATAEIAVLPQFSILNLEILSGAVSTADYSPPSVLFATVAVYRLIAVEELRIAFLPRFAIPQGSIHPSSRFPPVTGPRLPWLSTSMPAAPWFIQPTGALRAACRRSCLASRPPRRCPLWSVPRMATRPSPNSARRRTFNFSLVKVRVAFLPSIPSEGTLGDCISSHGPPTPQWLGEAP